MSASVAPASLEGSKVQDGLRTLTLHQPKRLVYGWGCLTEAISYLSELRPRHLHILTSASMLAAAQRVASTLTGKEMFVSIDRRGSGEPTVEDFRRALECARGQNADCILGIGGGSVLDMAKLVAAFLNSPQTVEQTFGIGLLRGRSCPLICMPATAGTGSEVSPNAILLDEQEKLKKAVISPWLVPDATFVDPELTVSMPRELTAATGLDALAHCIEAYTNRFAHPIADTWALDGIRLAGRFLLRAIEEPGDREAREGMALASMFGGLCLGPVNTAAAHALAYPLGGEYHIAHGVSVALVLPHVFRFNAPASLKRHAEAAVALGVERQGDSVATAMAGATRLTQMMRKSGLSTNPGNYGVPMAAIPTIAASAMKVTRLLRNNPRELTESDCVQIYSKAFTESDF
jgi:alcohol dehydrogenase